MVTIIMTRNLASVMQEIAAESRLSDLTHTKNHFMKSWSAVGLKSSKMIFFFLNRAF